MLGRLKKVVFTSGNSIAWAGFKAGVAVVVASAWAAVMARILETPIVILWFITVGVGTACYSILRYQPPPPPDPHEVEKRRQRIQMLERWEALLDDLYFMSDYWPRMSEHQVFSEMKFWMNPEVARDLTLYALERDKPGSAFKFKRAAYEEINHLKRRWELV
jgi:hypothetical protein